MSLKNRTAVITGATGASGSLIAHELASRQANLVLLDRHPDRLEGLMASLALPSESVLTQTVDLLDPAAVGSAAQTVVERFGRVDILLHLVGGWTGGKTLLEAPASDLEFMIGQHVWTSFYVVQAFVPHLVKNGWGRIVMITSPFAARPNAKGGPYAIGKAGQEAMMLTLSQELKGTGVTTNLLQVKTIDAKGEKNSALTPQNASWTTPGELAAAVMYLLSDEAGTVSGAKLPLFG